MDLEELAFQWKVRSDSDEFSQEEKAQLDDWLKQNVRHRVAFARATRGWERANLLVRVRPPKGETDPDLLLNLDLATAGGGEPPESRRPRVARLAFGSAFAAAACLALVVLWYQVDSKGWEPYATGIGGLEHIPLPDGISIHLNTDTAVAVSRQLREVRLTRGEALIDVPKDTAQPLTIIAGTRELQTNGGRFDVRVRNPDDIELVVDSGRVDVRTSHSTFAFAPRAADMVSAGYVARMRPGLIRVAWMAPDELARKTTWLAGLLSFSGESLAEVVSEFNRYNRKQIEISDPALAQRQIGGVFQATDPDGFVAALHVIIGVDATTIEGGSGWGYGKLRLSKGPTPR
jgi:transmembrane sensor